MKSILMYLNIPWDFIKQRPQFMAEKLSQYFNVLAYYNRPYRKTYLVQSSEKATQVNLVAKPKIPRKTNILKKIDNKIQSLFLKEYIKKYEYIWVMHPDQYEILKHKINGKKIIYDCMDDYSQFPYLSETQKKDLQAVEKNLVGRADYIFYTSKTLQNVHELRYKLKKKTHVVNNGFEPIERLEEDIKVKAFIEKVEGKKLIYIGAIAEWFDVELVQTLLQYRYDISVILFGPLEIELPHMERLYYYGKIPHSSIYTAMKYANILIMPFEINPLITAVDPIKVYEYIDSGKPVLVPEYEEMEKFNKYVTTYKDIEDCKKKLENLLEGTVANNLQPFRQSNTWEARAKQIYELLDNEGII